MRKTPLYDKHNESGGKIIDFAGWTLPVQYEKGIIQEHKIVRANAGLFDVSHMGEITIKGPQATDLIQYLVTNDISRLKTGQIIYSPMCYENGTTVDDLLVYKFTDTDYLLVVNASNTEKDFKWMCDNSKNFQAEVINSSDYYAQLAIQGPNAEQILQKVTDFDLSKIRFYKFAADIAIDNHNTIISRTGYTGEDGFEIYMAANSAPNIWDKLINAHNDLILSPIGLGARDTLRLEAALPLYGHELSDRINPLEAGLERFVKLNKDYFIGQETLKEYFNNGITRTIVGFEMIEKGIPRSEYTVYSNDQEIGYVTSGGFAPSLHKNIGLVLIDKGYAIIGNEIQIGIRNKKLKAVIIKKPFYKK